MNFKLRIAAAHVALVAMLVHALIPFGWMPASSPSIPFKICTMGGLVTMPGDQSNKGKQDQSPSGDRHDVCPFAAASHFAAPPSVAGVLTPAFVGLSTDAPAPGALAFRRALYQPQAPRAPPAFA